MATFFQWIHLTAAVIGVGAMCFMLVVLSPAMKTLDPDHRASLLKHVSRRFRWVAWSVIFLLLVSGFYNVRAFYWELHWGTLLMLLTVKITLAMVVFAIALCLTLPMKFLGWFQKRRNAWLTAAFSLAVVVILISAYLRRA